MFIPDPNFSIPDPGSKRFRIPNPGAKDSGSATLTGTPVHLGEGGMGVAGEKDHPRLTPGVHYSLLEDTTHHK
jgi:hypothetical protein